ncbi:MAG: alcohol dehydrogenase [Acidimicrobiaceae bacterium]|nr:alcohol dehydrogenase [Acidimicrobiaceae bacterium]
MRAVVYHRYGGPEVLEVVDLDEPKMAQDSVLVRIKAAGLNPADIKLRQGVMEQAMDAWFPVTPGWDLAGVVEAVGPAVGEFAVGDEVIGYVRQPILRYGAYAEKIATPACTLIRKPGRATWTEAAGLPLSALTAYQAVVHALHVREDETLLVHGGAGGVGSLAVQIAQAQGARVIATDAEINHDYLRSLGAEATAFGDGLVERVRSLAPDGVHAVFDTSGRGSLVTTASLARPDVRAASIVDPTSYTGTIAVYAQLNLDDLAAVTRLVEDAKVAVRVAATFPLAAAADAQRFLESGEALGKVILDIDG